MIKELKEQFERLEAERKAKRLREVEMEEEIKFLRKEKSKMNDELRMSREHLTSI